ncbi:hypothetical protein P3X46_005102 [Hevea brasiliensis]|uniref:VQ domain-containing protein n=1 Tax=Hevea brasiliensis TaxID=3981 RepID=A0ABQ9MYS2_HEVBR|nr:uncharacterized protein LOC110649700 [Hevea brasiliensis]KAJ9185464.1 hypothetical protein P3X46_005102 [Hevea brasiliensis]
MPNMFGGSSELPQKSFQIKQDDKFFSRLLSKESSMANPSFRVYYGDVTVAVPFMWESQPGTPKHSFGETTLPPLTPPPSYYSYSNKKPIKKHYSRSSLLNFLFSRINPKKTNNATSSSALSPTPSSASWSSLNSSSFLPSTPHERNRFSSLGSSFDSRAYDEEAAFGSPTSNHLCFGDGRRNRNGFNLKGCYAWW